MYSIWVPIIAGLAIIVLSVAWNLYFTTCLKKEENIRISYRAQVVQVMYCLCLVCPVLLGNSDDKVADALNYVKPTKHLDNILEKINEQTGI